MAKQDLNDTGDLPPDNRGIAATMRPALVQYFKRKCGSTVEAEDLAQDVLVRVLGHADWKSYDEAKGYIFRAAVNRWRDRHRRVMTHGVAVPLNEESVEGLAAQNPPERVLIASEELNQLARALGAMNVRTRTVLLLVKLEEMKIASVANMLGISISAVNKHLAKGISILAELRSRLERGG